MAVPMTDSQILRRQLEAVHIHRDWAWARGISSAVRKMDVSEETAHGIMAAIGALYVKKRD